MPEQPDYMNQHRIYTDRVDVPPGNDSDRGRGTFNLECQHGVDHVMTGDEKHYTAELLDTINTIARDILEQHKTIWKRGNSK
jgi:hypothetical protein